MINTNKDDKKEKIIDKISSHNSSFEHRDKTNTKIIQKQLIEMGYNIDLINQVIRYFQVTSIEVALDYLSKTNDKWNHPFVFYDENEIKFKNDINTCMICLDKPETHRINYTTVFSPIIENEIHRSESFNLKKTFSRESIGKADISLKKPRELECDICLSPIEESYSLECKHQYCKDCILDYLVNKITNAEVENIKCPSKDCVVNIKEEIIQSLVSPKDYDKYLKFMRRANYSKIPNSCICPVPDCDSYGLKITSNKEVNRPNNYFISCQKGHIFCYNCNQISHPGISCDSKLENEFFKWKESKTVKKCTMCGFYIEKNFGCNHMTCANKACNYEFCWICMEPYNQTHYNNAASPCFGLQYVNENAFVVRSRILRYIRLLCVYFGMLITGILGYVFFSFAFAAMMFIFVGIKISQTIYDRTNMLVLISIPCLIDRNQF